MDFQGFISVLRAKLALNINHSKIELRIESLRAVFMLGMGVALLSSCSAPRVISIQHIAYYVDGKLGSDSSPGSKESAWRTIQKAADTMRAGDSVTILAGTYNERVRINFSGESGAPIVYQGSGAVVMQGFTIDANYVTINSFEITDTPDADRDGVGIFVNGTSCDLENNYIHYATRGGIFLSPQSSHCTINKNRLYRNSQNGLDVEGQNHLITNNEIWGTIQYHPKWSNPPGWVDADGIRFFGSGHLFRGNYIHDISMGDPLNPNPHIDAFQTWDDPASPAGSDCTFERNIITLGFATTGFQLEGGSHNLIIRNNIVHAFVGLNAYKNGRAPYTTPSDLYILNNLFSGDLAYQPEQNTAGISLQDVSTSVVENNILLDQRSQTIWVVTGVQLAIDYNLIDNSDGSQPPGFPQPHDLWSVNPQFVNPGAGDYHLQLSSPAIGAGISLSKVTDNMDGALRVRHHGSDIGPY